MLLTILYLALRWWMRDFAWLGSGSLWDVWAGALLQIGAAAPVPGWVFALLAVGKALIFSRSRQ